mmetsp:Transcript_140436/g.391528  ORF Transcript_140436/g.391528 Transcript_140436/m.391528 type:complete len:220 (+) Transcript_140436:696-1355(+)
MAPTSQRITTTMKKARPQMISRTIARTRSDNTGSHVKASMPSTPQPTLMRIVVKVLLTMASSASARTKARVVYQARFAVTDAIVFLESTNSSQFPMYSRILRDEASGETLTLKLNAQAFIVRSTIHRLSCASVGLLLYHRMSSASKSRDGNLLELSRNQLRKLPTQHFESTTKRRGGRSVHIASMARCAQGLLGSNSGSKLQTSLGLPMSGVDRGARRP